MKNPLLILLAALAVAVTAGAHAYRLGSLAIGHPWSYPTPASAAAGAGFLTVTNHGRTEDRLIAVASPAARRVELHEMSMDGGIMRMREVKGGMAIAPGATLTLAPGGYHIMFIGPTHPFKVGEMIPATLTFAHAGAIRVGFLVQPRDAAPAMGKMPGMQH
jgi:periplasmic copper chaperone A